MDKIWCATPIDVAHFTIFVPLNKNQLTRSSALWGKLNVN